MPDPNPHSLTVPDRAEAVAAAMQAIAPCTGIAGACITLPIATTGATLTPTD